MCVCLVIRVTPASTYTNNTKRHFVCIIVNVSKLEKLTRMQTFVYYIPTAAIENYICT